MSQLARRLGLFDATMIVMGGIIGSGIFINPYIVARQLHTPALILGAWALGGLIALSGGFIWAELAARRPLLGGQYAYLREAYHPSVAFIYGWTLLLVTQTGGMAAVAVTFARYFLDVTRLEVADGWIAVAVLAVLTIINCLGVRAGSTAQNLLMATKICAIAGLVVCGLVFAGHPGPASTPAHLSWSTAGAALTPIAFSYGGWQTSSFMSAELRDPRRDLTRGLLIGVLGVVVLYLSVNFVYLRVLGPDGLAATTTPASTAMQLAIGPRGGAVTAIVIAISTLGFLSQGMLTAPRVYFAMAEDGLFFRSVAFVSKSTQVPVVAIALQGALAIAIALSGRYEQILNYVISSDFIFFGLTAATLFVFRRRQQPGENVRYRVPGHPWTTGLFVTASALIVAGTVYSHPRESLTGWLILASGIPVYLFWSRFGARKGAA
ncbi:MAG TPA: amino acid permease [Bryobacteraceae bacterium]|nr:amino acid permease [Bryobacteraceae bacterium]